MLLRSLTRALRGPRALVYIVFLRSEEVAKLLDGQAPAALTKSAPGALGVLGSLAPEEALAASTLQEASEAKWWL